MSDRDVEKSGSQDGLTADSKAEDDTDPYFVSFKGSEDPADPQNWSRKQKWSIVGMMSTMTLLVYAAWHFCLVTSPTDQIQESCHPNVRTCRSIDLQRLLVYKSNRSNSSRVHLGTGRSLWTSACTFVSSNSSFIEPYLERLRPLGKALGKALG